MFTLIESIEDLETLNEELLKKSYVGVDTEFRRTNKANMRLALLQINDNEEVYLIDTVLIQDPKDKISFLFSNSVTKIFHSCKEDLEAIYSWTGKEMVNIFDTQLANSFIEGDYSISYQNLVENKLDIILEKKETRSNWLRRPLSDSQLKYAALDVEYLIPLYIDQVKALNQINKLDWHDEDIAKLIEVTFNPNFSTEVTRTLPKIQEAELLKRFNKIVNTISAQQKINPTLFFSKKAQKGFLRLVLIQGLNEACKEITNWRAGLIKEELLLLLK